MTNREKVVGKMERKTRERKEKNQPEREGDVPLATPLTAPLVIATLVADGRGTGIPFSSPLAPPASIGSSSASMTKS